MRRIATILLLFAALAAAAGAFALRSRVGHPVTRRMQQDARGMAGRPVPLPSSALPGRPTVLIFIKDECPCSEAADPCYRRLFDAYGTRVNFVGIIDAQPADTARWARDHHTPYPVVSDPDALTMRTFGARQSAYTALVSPDGRIERVWPGYSAEMLRALGARLAELSAIPEVPLNLADAPQSLTSGCPFDLVSQDD